MPENKIDRNGLLRARITMQMLSQRWRNDVEELLREPERMHEALEKALCAYDGSHDFSFLMQCRHHLKKAVKCPHNGLIMSEDTKVLIEEMVKAIETLLGEVQE